MRVLIADDHRAGAIAMAALLRAMGHEVEWLRNGRELSERLALPRATDLLLLDLDLGDADGADVVSCAREDGLSVPVTVIVSARSREQVMQAAVRIGAAGILSKPFTVQTMIAVIAEAASADPTTRAD